MRDAYASGKVHIGWATLDMIPLFVEALAQGLPHDAASVPKIDWSKAMTASSAAKT